MSSSQSTYGMSAERGQVGVSVLGPLWWPNTSCPLLFTGIVSMFSLRVVSPPSFLCYSALVNQGQYVTLKLKFFI